MKKRKCLMIDWTDAASTGGWHHDDDIPHGGIPCRTIGFVISEDEEALHVAASHSDRSHADVVSIPHGCITRRRVVRIP